MNRVFMYAAIILVSAATVNGQWHQEASVGSPESKIQIGFRGGLNFASMSGGLWGYSQSLEELVEEARRSGEIQGNGGIEESSVSGLVFGGFINYKISDMFSIQPEILYVKKGVKATGTATLTALDYYGEPVVQYTMQISEQLNLTYMEIPFLAKVSIPMGGMVRPSLFVGPSLSLTLSGEYDLDALATMSYLYSEERARFSGKPEISNMESTDLGIVVGGDVGISLGQANLLLDVRYTIGVSGQFGSTDFDDLPEFYEDSIPTEFPVANIDAETVPDKKNRALSITAGVSLNL